MSDRDLERVINAAYRAMLAAQTESERRIQCDRLTALVKMRSQERVAQMEREKGLLH